MRRVAWSQLKSAMEPGLPLELCLLIEVLQVLPSPNAKVSVMLRPSNILVGEDGSVSIGAGRLEPAGQEQRYAAPEVDAEGAGDVRAAIYCVGAMLFEAVSGYPFESNALVHQELFGSRAMAKAAGLGAGFWEIQLLEAALRATSPEPRERWATAAEFAGDLQKVAKERIASRTALAEWVKAVLGAGVAVRGQAGQAGQAGQGALAGDAEPTVAIASAGRIAASTGSFFEVEPKTLPRHTASTGHFDPEPATLPRHQPNVQRHATLLGVGVSAVQQAVQQAVHQAAQSAAAGRGDKTSSPPAGRHQTLVGVGFRPPPNEQPVLLVKSAVPPEDEVTQQLGSRRTAGVADQPARNEPPAQTAESSQVGVSVPPVESKVDLQSDSEPWVGAPKKRARGGWFVLAFVTACGAAGALEYQGGHVTRSIESLRPFVIESLPTQPTPSPSDPKREQQSAGAPAPSAAPKAASGAAQHATDTVQPAGDAEALDSAAPDAVPHCDDCDEGDTIVVEPANEPQADEPDPAQKTKPQVVPRPVPKRRRRPAESRDYGI